MSTQMEPVGVPQGAIHPPSYSQVDSGYTTNVIVASTPTPQQTIIIARQIRPSTYLGLAVFVALFFNPIFGVIAIVFSILSSNEFENGDVEAARKHGRTSMILSVVGMLLGIVAVIILIYWTVAILPYEIIRDVSNDITPDGGSKPSCSSNTDSLSCNTWDECTWKSDINTCFDYCGSYSSKSKCNGKNYCIWKSDYIYDSAGCKDYCRRYSTSSRCNSFTKCTWNLLSDTCSEASSSRTTMKSTVRSTAIPRSCNTWGTSWSCNAAANCRWKSSKCADRCAWYSSLSACNARRNCIWDWNQCKDLAVTTRRPTKSTSSSNSRCNQYWSEYTCSMKNTCIWRFNQCVDYCAHYTESFTCNGRPYCRWSNGFCAIIDRTTTEY